MGSGWGHPQGEINMAAVVLGCDMTLLRTRYVSHISPLCTGLRKHHVHLVGLSFLVLKTVWRCLLAENSDYYKLF